MTAIDFHALGAARLASAGSAQSEADWAGVFKPQQPFPFTWGPFWKLYVQYQVDDLAAEVGFFMDVVGLESTIICAEQVVLSSPDRDFHFSVVPTPEGGQPTPAATIALAFMIEDLERVVAELTDRGVTFTTGPTAMAEGDPMSRAVCRAPSGVAVELWEFRPPDEG